jgi:hypothetical protein
MTPGAAGESGSADNTLIYVEKDLILPIAARLVGTMVSSGSTRAASGGLNWVAAATASYSSEKSTEIEMAKLFPEDVFHYCYPQIIHRGLTVRKYCTGVASHELVPPNVVAVSGVLRISGSTPPQYDPFDPPKIDLPNQYRLYGYRTFYAALEAEGFIVPIYFLADSADMVFYANNKPVEVVSVIKWSPSYEVGGHMLNVVMICAALLLAK